ncbi:MAG TPA: threonine/serine dehydratase [Streptosporangiaceae bacterium]|nr:threonine/serine dehydratase [Streptosporangiaceae bacterium]
MLELREIQDAASRLAGVSVRTPLVPYPRVTPPLLLKPESLQPTGAFKLRGAYAAITAGLDQAREHGVVAHSSGNHGHAVAYAAALLGVRAAVVVPANAPKAKTEAIERYGAELVIVEATLAARIAASDQLVAERGSLLVRPFDDRNVMAGQGTVGLEIAADSPVPDPLVLVPVSGGGLIGGIAAALAATLPGATVIGVEPADAADAQESLRRGERVAWPVERVQRTIADALRVEQVGALPFAHIRELVSDIVTVTDDELRQAIRRLALDVRLVAEPGGAAATAACLFRAAELPPDRTRIAVLSGGNIDPDLLAATLSTNMLDVLCVPPLPTPPPGSCCSSWRAEWHTCSAPAAGSC